MLYLYELVCFDVLGSSSFYRFLFYYTFVTSQLLSQCSGDIVAGQVARNISQCNRRCPKRNRKQRLCKFEGEKRCIMGFEKKDNGKYLWPAGSAGNSPKDHTVFVFSVLDWNYHCSCSGGSCGGMY